jgi:hypothetical protein
VLCLEVAEASARSFSRRVSSSFAEKVDVEVAGARANEYKSSGPKRSPRIAIDLVALAHLSRTGDAWRTVRVEDHDLEEAIRCIPDPSTKTSQLVQEGVGIVFLLPRPVNICKQHIEHVALGHAAVGAPETNQA